MSAVNPLPMALHEDVPFFNESLRYTAAETGFISRLIEKDYFCTLVLQHLSESDVTLVFKGGTCLAKIHAGFYRLSEDLDFSISMPVDSVRSVRSKAANAFKAAVRAIPAKLRSLSIVEEVAGANGSRQYVATAGYESTLGRNKETIKIEVGLREPLLMPEETASAQTLLLDPIRGGPTLQAINVRCISYIEAMAEKFRAALTRRDVAIRDFYDIDHAIGRRELDPLQPDLLELIRAKVAVSGNGPIDSAEYRLQALRLQVDSQLRPVLRPHDFNRFSLDRAFDVVYTIARAI